jgi:hypothetical protein
MFIMSRTDFRLEKGSLHTEVYPSLREYCSSRGYELHITDLHWKSDLETKQDNEFPELCLEELKRESLVSNVQSDFLHLHLLHCYTVASLHVTCIV